MHAIEKIMAKAGGKRSVTAGEIINARVSFAEINDLYLQTVYSFYEMGGKRVWDKNRAAFVFDHYAPCPSIEAARNHAEMRRFAEENELTYHFDVNAGVCHQVMPEKGVILPGSVIVATDSHTTTHGAFGALGTGVGATDMAALLITGEIWMRVPEIVEIRIDGTPPKGVYPKDVILHILGDRKADGAVYKAVAFTGDYVERLSVAGRMVLCNMAVEMGAKTAYMQPNRAVLDYLGERAAAPFTVEETDAGYRYAERYTYDVGKLAPQIAAPDSVDNVRPITEAGDVKVHQGVIGTCTGGRVEDIAVGARILKNERLAPWVRLIVIPASGEVLRECMEKGYIQDLLDAGATLATPGCGPCLGAHDGVIAPGEVCVTASNRNFPGRMGSAESSLYLASPATVAASVLNGRITDPRSCL